MRHPLIWVVTLVCVAAAAFPASAADIAIARLTNPQGDFVGIATFAESDDGVMITVNLRGMPPGVHALHIHAAGSCEKPDFKTAKGHFNPYGRKHGLKNPEGAHAGDLPNITIGPDGTGAAVVTAPLVTLGDGPASLFQDGGTAIMIHAGPDDYMSDPAGAAGPRIACGVIERAE
jgi:Cu-Zn family superoxide dismutase